MRKLLLPALASCVVLAASAPVASAAKAHTAASAIPYILKVQKTHSSKIGALQDLASGFQDAFKRLDASVSGLQSTVATIVAGVPTIINGLNALKSGLTTVGAGLTTVGAGLTALSAAVQGPGIAGQLGAAGPAAPGTGNPATPSTLPAGTLYREIVVSTTGPYPAGTPIGARTWIKMPDVASLGYNNTYVCTSAGTTGAGTGGGYAVTCTGGT